MSYYTNEEREKLVGLLGFEPGEVSITPEEYNILPKNKRPKFNIRKMDAELQAEYSEIFKKKCEKIQKEKKTKTLNDADVIRASSYAALKTCLKGWENYRSAEGKKAVFGKNKQGQPLDMTISILPTKIQQLLSNAVFGDVN